MKTYLDCIPCFLRQALESSRLAGADEVLQKEILDEICGLIPAFSLNSSPPEMGRIIYNTVRRVTSNDDPFKEVKTRSNQLALKLILELRKRIESSENKFLTAVELAIAGNIIDYGVRNSFKIEQQVKDFLDGNFDVHCKYNKPIFAYQQFQQALQQAGKILYIADNAGETVFDLLLIEQIKTLFNIDDIVYAVKDKPIINDALREDAIIAGIDKVAKVISSGCDAPGTILKLCSDEFIQLYNNADLVISKGQGNFEALSGEDKSIYFLFIAKCSVVARDLECDVGDVILSCANAAAKLLQKNA